MDLYFTREALLFLRGQGLASPGRRNDGLLIGHKRGKRFVVEKAFPSSHGFFSSEKEFRALQDLFENRIIGFFTFHATIGKTRKVLHPFGYGKLFLKVTVRRNNSLSLKPYVIEYNRSFFLSPLPHQARSKGGT